MRTAPFGLDVDPSPDRAHELLQRELLKPDYHDDNLLERFVDWLGREVDGTVRSASGAPSLSTFLAILIAVALLVALGLLLSRARRTARAGSERRAVLTAEVVSAAEVRARAEAALAAGRHEEAVVEGFRALALRQVERGRLEETPGATAHEVAASLAGEFPSRRGRVDDAALLFELVLYGDRPATRDQAVGILGLDDELAVAR